MTRGLKTEIRGNHHSFLITANGVVVAMATNHGNAIARARSIEDALPLRTLNCLCCGTTFKSKHVGNRLCRQCKELT